MIFAICIGVLSAVVVLIAMTRINLKKFMGYPAIMDVVVTALLIWMLHGSYVGMVAAVIGGLFFSGMITVIRRTYGYSRLERKGLGLAWVDYQGSWCNAASHLNQLNNKGSDLCSSLKLSKPLTACIAVLFVSAFVL